MCLVFDQSTHRQQLLNGCRITLTEILSCFLGILLEICTVYFAKYVRWGEPLDVMENIGWELYAEIYICIRTVVC